MIIFESLFLRQMFLCRLTDFCPGARSFGPQFFTDGVCGGIGVTSATAEPLQVWQDIGLESSGTIPPSKPGESGDCGSELGAELPRGGFELKVEPLASGSFAKVLC